MSSIESISKVGDAQYKVVVNAEGERRTFLFRVEVHKEVEFVTWEQDFGVWTQWDPGKAKLLLAAVLAFHQVGSIPS